MKNLICPRCKEKGSGLHDTWVLNEIKKKYYPYYRVAHSKNGKIEWCYIPKKIAEEMIKKQREKKRLKKSKKSK